MSLSALIKKYEAQLMSLPNVTGIGVGKRAGKGIIQVFVTRKVPESALQPHEIIPKKLEKYEINVEESGVLLAQSDPRT